MNFYKGFLGHWIDLIRKSWLENDANPMGWTSIRQIFFLEGLVWGPQDILK